MHRLELLTRHLSLEVGNDVGGIVIRDRRTPSYKDTAESVSVFASLHDQSDSEWTHQFQYHRIR